MLAQTRRSQARDDAIVKFRIDPGSKTPASEQVRSQVATAIAKGKLLPGDRLPAVRELALELGLAPNTVAKAYRGLGAAELVEGRGRSGTFVRPAPRRQGEEAVAQLDEAAHAYAARARRLGFDVETSLAAARRAIRPG